jgi:cell division transport system permease protein
MSAQRPGRIMPRWEGATPLDIVIAVMAFLAALAVAAALIAERTAQGWREGLSAGITVQILPPADGAAEPSLRKESADVLALLHATNGIAHVQAVREQDARELVAPWLGSGATAGDLPLPRLVDATITPGAAIDLSLLARRLKSAAPDSILDDHTHWLGRLKQLASGVIWSAYGVLALIGLATAAAVTFATRAGLAAHHDIVSLLHQMGARSGFIAAAFEWHYFLSAVIASAIGTAAALVLFAVLGTVESVGMEPVPFLPPLSLGPLELVWLLAVPVAAGLIAVLTARISVLAVVVRNY